MTDAEIIKIVNESMVAEFELDPDMMKPESHLINDLEMDSLDFVDLVVVLQHAFDVKLRDDPNVREIQTLGDIYKLVLSKKGIAEDSQ
jgi:acyl carrier protein